MNVSPGGIAGNAPAIAVGGNHKSPRWAAPGETSEAQLGALRPTNRRHCTGHPWPDLVPRLRAEEPSLGEGPGEHDRAGGAGIRPGQVPIRCRTADSAAIEPGFSGRTYYIRVGGCFSFVPGLPTCRRWCRTRSSAIASNSPLAEASSPFDERVGRFGCRASRRGGVAAKSSSAQNEAQESQLADTPRSGTTGSCKGLLTMASSAETSREG
jgi:hypothetical protein